MADSENVPATITFDTWREAINASMEGTKKYIMFGKPLGLMGAATDLEAGFEPLVNQRLSGLDPAMAKDMRDGLEFAHDICGDPWRSAFTSWLQHDDAAATLIRNAANNPAGFSYHGFIGDLTEAFGQELAKGEHPVVSQFYRPDAPDAVQYKARLGDGTWQDISQQDVLACMRNPNGPHMFHLANHAFLDNENIDLNKLQNEFSKLFEGSRLPVADAQEPRPQMATWDIAALGPKDSITVFATHTRENRFLNLAQLFRRLDGIDRAHEQPQADDFRHVAPIAVDMVETLLKAIVVDADMDKIHSPKPGAGKPVFFDQTVTLRPDAIDIIRRQRYRGFSKGGNDFRDGMRLLVHTLEAGVVSPEGFTTRDLVNNISMIVFGLNEKPMADHYRTHGVHVPIVSSKHDITAPIPAFPHEEKEPVFNYAGNQAGDGHSPGYAVDGMLADWRIHDLLRMAGAVSQGQAAITDVNLLAEGAAYNPNILMLEVAPGTTDAMMDTCAGPMNAALRKAGLGDTTLKRIDGNHSRQRYLLVNNDTTTQLTTPENMAKLQAVLRSLSSPCGARVVDAHAATANRPDMGLWVSQATAFGKTSLLKRHLLDVEKGKRDPDSVIDTATLTQFVQRDNLRDVREHPRTARNLEKHTRITMTEPATGEQSR